MASMLQLWERFRIFLREGERAFSNITNSVSSRETVSRQADISAAVGVGSHTARARESLSLQRNASVSIHTGKP